MNRSVLVTALLALAASTSLVPGASANVKRVYVTTRVEQPPQIDGRLDDAAWAVGTWAGDFLQQLPREGVPPSQPTSFKILYDDAYLYVAIRAHDDEPAGIERRGGRRDELVGDIVGVAFDSYHDLRTAYEFNLTAAGTKIDLMHKPPKVWDTTWDAVWDGAVGLEDSAWVAEMRIPLGQLRFASGTEQVWGLHLWRWIHRYEEESQFNLIASDAAVMVPYFGELHGLDLQRRRRIELLPYATARGSTYESIDGDPFADGRDGFAGAGLDAKVGLSNAFTMDITINPDFGQVEADPSTINLTAFETFYEEKRPFFLEGSNLFAYEFEGEEIFYSRRIGSQPKYRPSLGPGQYLRMPEATTIAGAVKVTGKTAGGVSIGILESLTAAESATLQLPDGRHRQTVEPLTNYLVARLESEHNDGRTVMTGMATAVNRNIDDSALDFLPTDAYTGGVGFSHYLPGHTYYTKLNLVGSTVAGSTLAIDRLQRSSMHFYQRPDADHLTLDSTRTRLSGTGGSVEVGRAGMGRWRFSEEFSWQSPGLDFADAGFMRTPSDRLNLESVLQYVVTEETRHFRSYSIGFDHSSEWNLGGDMNGLFGRLRFEGQLTNYWRLTGSAMRTQASLDPHLLRGGPSLRVPGGWYVGAGMRTDTRAALTVGGNGSAQWGDSNGSSRYTVSPDVTLRVSEGLSLSAGFSLQWNRDELQYVTRLDGPGAGRFVLGTIDQRTASATLRASYSIRPNLIVQFYGQPFVSAGAYSEFKEVSNPRADSYADRFVLLNAREQRDPAGPTTIGVDENGDGTIDVRFPHPDFTFREFRSNFVIRWEYRPGSNLYLVWSQVRTGGSNDGQFHLTQDFRRIYDLHPHNVFAIKLSYWLGT